MLMCTRARARGMCMEVDIDTVVSKSVCAMEAVFSSCKPKEADQNGNGRCVEVCPIQRVLHSSGEADSSRTDAHHAISAAMPANRTRNAPRHGAKTASTGEALVLRAGTGRWQEADAPRCALYNSWHSPHIREHAQDFRGWV